MVKKGKHKVMVLAVVAGLYVLMFVLGNNLLQEVSADSETSTFTTTVSGALPSISNMVCCFKDHDAANYDSSTDCFSHPEATGYTISEGEPYDLMCNFTVTDSNGYQDLTDGWVNITWYHDSATWATAEDNDIAYANASCLNVSATGTGTTMVFECAIYEIKHWADAGAWHLNVNVSDSPSGSGSPSTGDFAIANLTSIWHSGNIDFGSMGLGETGSSGDTGVIDQEHVINNTGNTIINIQVASTAADMTCTIGTIPAGNIHYEDEGDADGTYVAYGSACGTLTDANNWDCTEVALQDCSDACAEAAYPLNSTFWGIEIPGSGVGGSCTLDVTFSAVQGSDNP